MRTPIQWMTAIQKRILRQDNIVIFRLGGPLLQPPDLGPLKLVRMGNKHPLDLALVDATMQRAGETEVDAAERFSRGHEFFALQDAGQILSFRWVNFGEDRAGHVQLHAAPHRAYLYNGFTLPEFRGRKLTHILMLHMRALLAEDGFDDLVTGTNATNSNSLRSKRKGGLKQVSTVRAWVVLHKFRLPGSTIHHEQTAHEIFGPNEATEMSAAQNRP